MLRLVSCDTNILLHALNLDSPNHQAAERYLASTSSNFRICELVLVELYVLLRNPAVFNKPLSGAQAAATCEAFRCNPTWGGVLDQPGPTARIMDAVWKAAAEKGFARRRIFDARLALTLRHYGVTEFATQNLKDFQGFGFTLVTNPLN